MNQAASHVTINYLINRVMVMKIVIVWIVILYCHKFKWICIDITWIDSLKKTHERMFGKRERNVTVTTVSRSVDPCHYLVALWETPILKKHFVFMFSHERHHSKIYSMLYYCCFTYYLSYLQYIKVMIIPII